VIDHAHSRDAAVLGGAIISVLKSVSDVGDVHLAANAQGPPDLARAVAVPSTDTVAGIDFKAPNRVAFDVTFTCPSLDRSRRFPVEIKATRAAGALASTSAFVECRALPEPKPPRVHIPPVAIAPAVAVLPPPPPPPNIPSQPNPNPNPNPQPNPAQQTQSQAQGAVAAQEQEQPQLAIAYEADSVPNPARAEQGRAREEYRMSRYSEGGPSADALFLVVAAALTLSFGAGLVLLDRSRLQLARQHQASTNHRRK
jgi:hypothetical protein